MSKVQGKESGILSSLSHAGIADELESRLRDLERNIAVAREFIKLADESYSELRHKWNILQQERKNKPETDITDSTPPQHRKTEESRKAKEHAKLKEGTESETDETEATDSDDSDNIPTFPMFQSRAKKTNASSKKTESPTESSNSEGSKGSKKTRRGSKSKASR